MKFILVLASAATSQLIEIGGKCAETPILSDFELARYGGRWYEQVRYPTNFDTPDDKCITAFYGGIDETTVSVNNSAIIPIYSTGEEKANWIYGTAVQVRVRL